VNNNKSANAPRLAAIFGSEQDCSNIHMVDVHTDSLERARIAARRAASRGAERVA
jgi:hypothetical protein